MGVDLVHKFSLFMVEMAPLSEAYTAAEVNLISPIGRDAGVPAWKRMKGD